MSMTIDIRVPVGLPVKETAKFIGLCETVGFNGVGVHDHQHSGRDVFVTLALAAEQTEHLKLYPVTSNPITRHPAVLASLAHTLEEIAPERVLLTIGPGFLSVGNIGHPKATLHEMRHAFNTIKGLLRGETIAMGTTQSRMRNTSAKPTPVYMTAAGPEMIKLAGEVADGVMLRVGLHPNAISSARKLLRDGAKRSGRTLQDFPTIFIVDMSIDSDGTTSRRWAQRWMSPTLPWLHYPSKANFRWFRESGIDLPRDISPDQITDDIAERISDVFGLFGTPQQCAESLIRARDEAGAEHIFVFPVHSIEGGYDMPIPEIAAFRDIIFPRLTS